MATQKTKRRVGGKGQSTSSPVGKRSRTKSAAGRDDRSLQKRRPPKPKAHAGEAPRGEEPRFPIVGIGASAGGLEAIEQFLGSVPQNSGTAFVVIQHLDPNHKGMMVELLQRGTSMPVAEAVGHLKCDANHAGGLPPAREWR